MSEHAYGLMFWGGGIVAGSGIGNDNVGTVAIVICILGLVGLLRPYFE